MYTVTVLKNSIIIEITDVYTSTVFTFLMGSTPFMFKRLMCRLDQYNIVYIIIYILLYLNAERNL